MIIERVRGPHIDLSVAAEQPAPGNSALQPETGLSIKRLTSCSLYNQQVPRSLQTTSNSPTSGFFAGYSRYSCMNVTGGYAFALTTKDDGALWRVGDGEFVGLLRGGSGFRLFESRDPRWDRSGLSGRNTIIRYCYGTHIYEQDALVGPTSERIIGTTPMPITSKGDADWSDDGRYFPVVMVKQADNGKGTKAIYTVGVFDAVEGALLAGTIDYNLNDPTVVLNGCDMSPDGRWLWVQQQYFSMDDIRAGILKPKSVAIRGGHGDWCRLADGSPAYVWQESAVDHIMCYQPDTETLFAVMGHKELGWCGLHISGSAPGWCLVSTYPGFSVTWDRNQIMLLELKPTNSVQRPEYDSSVTADKWTASYLLDAQQPRIIRLTSMNNTWHSYFTEAAASSTPDGKHLCFGGNWNNTANIEVYTVTMPDNWSKDMTTPTDTTTPPTDTTSQVQVLFLDGKYKLTIEKLGDTTTPPPVVDPPSATTTTQVALQAEACNSLYWDKGVTLGGTTRGNYHSCIAIRKGSWTYVNAAGSTVACTFDQVWQSSYRHTSVVLRFDLSAFVGKSIISAKLRLNANNPAGGSDGGSLPKGNERIPIRTISINDWTPAYLKDNYADTSEYNWNGASFINSQEEPNLPAVPWSSATSNLDKYGRVGDITSVRGDIIAEISWAKDDNSHSTDFADVLNVLLASGQTKISMYLDTDGALGTDAFGNNSNTYNPKFTGHVMFYSLLEADETKRPALEVEV